MANRKEYDMLFSLNAQLGSSYTGTFTKAQQQLIGMQKELGTLAKRQSDITAYQRQQSAAESTQKKLEVLQQQYDNIQREMGETGKYSSTLANEMLAKQQQIDKTSDSLKTQGQKLGQMGAALRDAGVDTENLGKASADLTAEIDTLKQKQEEAADKANDFGAASAQAFGAIQQAIIAAGIAKALKEIYNWYSECIDTSVEFESVMAGVRRTVSGSDAELFAISEAFKEMSLEMPITTSELGGIAEAAGQLGIAREDITEFTRVMAMLATATDLTADNAATMLAQFANITGLDPKDYGKLGSVVAELGDATATTASKVVDMSQGLAAAASIAGMSETDILGISAAVGSLGIEAQAGSTAMSTLIQMLYKAVETGDKLENFASVANMSAYEFTSAWGIDAVGAMDAFIQGLNDTERNGSSAIVILDDLGITNTRQTKAILGLAQAGDLLSNTVAQGNIAWEENTALQAKADVMYDTTKSKLVMMQNAYDNLKIAIGDNFTPALQGMYAAGTDALKGVTEFIRKNPALLKAVTAFVGVLGAVVVALAAYTAAAKVAAVMNAALASSLGSILAVAAAFAGLVAVVTLLSEMTSEQTDETWNLSAASRAQYIELRDLNAEYDKTVKIYGDTSYEAQSLQWRINELTAEFNAGKQTADEYLAANKLLIDSYWDQEAAQKAAYEEIDTENQKAGVLIDQLEKLATSTGSATDKQGQMEAIMSALNEIMPELALNYDLLIGGNEEYLELLRQEAIEQARIKQFEQDKANYAAAVTSRPELEAAVERARDELALRKEYLEYSREQYSLAQAYSDMEEQGKLSAQVREAERLYKAAQDGLDGAVAAYEDNEAEYERLNSSIGDYIRNKEEEIALTADIDGLLGNVTAQMSALAEAYDAAYSAALGSVQGQYSLWDEAAEVAAVSAVKINNALESQIKYWQGYNSNISELSDRAVSIEGLSEMIASFADGSADSVNAIAGMAAATDEDLAEMVAKWQLLKDEQNTVAESLAELETDFTDSMNDLQSEFASTIRSMSLGEEAVNSAKETIQGFITGAEDMLPEIEAAYKRIAQSALSALSYGSVIGIAGGDANVSRYSYVHGSHAEGLDYVPFDGYIAELHKGERVLTADEAQLVTFAPQLMAALSAVSVNTNAVMAEHGGGNGVIYITVAPTYQTSGAESPSQIESILSANNDNLRELVIDVLEEQGIDADRRVYR